MFLSYAVIGSFRSSSYPGVELPNPKEAGTAASKEPLGLQPPEIPPLHLERRL